MSSVAITYFPLRLGADRLNALARLLSPAERARGERFATARLRASYVAARGQVREIVASYGQRSAVEIEIGLGSNGKPRLLGDLWELKMSISHTRDFGMCALSRQSEIGVDVESISGDIDWRGIGQTVFDARELDVIESSLAPETFLRFYRLWTCKEAVMKGDGRGFFLPPDSFLVPTCVWAGEPSEPATIEVDGRQWRIESCGHAPPAHVAALAREFTSPSLVVDPPTYAWWPVGSRASAFR